MYAKYADYFEVNPNFKAVIDASVLDENPDEWLKYYPHEPFIHILRTVLEKMEKLDKSLWIYGAYGTGKSHTALVLRKLFLETERERVERYVADREAIFPRPVANELFKWRGKKVLPVFTSGAEGLSRPDQLLVRMQMAITDACRQCGYEVPVQGNAETMVSRIEEDGGKVFWKKRDEMQNHLDYLTSDITNVVQLRGQLKKGGDYAGKLLMDVRDVLEATSVFLDLKLPSFLKWVDQIREANKISRILFLWDEFTSYVNENRLQLVTFRGLAEPEALSKGFIFVPITHMQLSAFVAEGSDTAMKAKDGFEFCELKIPANTVFRLGNDALRIKADKKAEWERERAELEKTIQPLVESYMLKDDKIPDVSLSDFAGILPLHPMAAFLLIHLAEQAGSNVRSFFDYLRSTNGESEFQKFIEQGGPAVQGRQFLTIDYLWHYFVERDDLNKSKAVCEIGNEFARRKTMCAFDLQEERIFKTVCLFNIMARVVGNNGHPLLMNTMENVVRAFEGDGEILNVREKVMSLVNDKHCCDVYGDYVALFGNGPSVDPTPYLAQFRRYIAEPTADAIKKDKFSGQQPIHKRFEIRGFNGAEIKYSDIVKRTNYGEKGEGNKILIAFLFAQNGAGQLEVPEKATKLARQYAGMRILYVSFPEQSFCEDNKNNWMDFCEQRARLENADNASKETFQKACDRILDQWKRKIESPDQKVLVTITPKQQGGEPHTEKTTWPHLMDLLKKHMDIWFPCGCDRFSGNYATAFKENCDALSGWAKAGFSGTGQGKFIGLINIFKKENITWEPDWFDRNPEHPLTKMRDRATERCKETLSRGSAFSLRRLYIDFQRAPYGLQCYNYSAFVLGFITREWPDSGFQWEDGTAGGDLTQEILADIIDSVVKDDGKNNIRNEKKICRLSKEERSFKSGMTKIFGLQTSKDATTVQCVADVHSKIPQIFHIPIGALAGFICKHDQTDLRDKLAETIGRLEKALSLSSRNDGQRKPIVKEIGATFIQNPDIVEALRKYVTPDTLQIAFQEFVDTNGEGPRLKELACEVHDPGSEYCAVVQQKLPDSAGGLWKNEDVVPIISEVCAQYQVIYSVQRLCGISSYLSWDSALEKLRKAVFEDNCVSLDYLSGTMPFVTDLGALLDSAQCTDSQKLAKLLGQQEENVKALFFDPSHSAQIDALKKVCEAANLEIGADAKACLSILPNCAKLNAKEFSYAAVNAAEKTRLESVKAQIAGLWSDKTGSVSPAEWASANRRPADILFEDEAVADEICRVVSRPTDFQTDKILETMKKMRKEGTFETCGERREAMFIRRYLPKRYRNLGITADVLAAAFQRELGNDPNSWKDDARRAAVMEALVKEVYAKSIKPQIMNGIRRKSDSEAKGLLLKIVEECPELGIRLMNEV